MKFRETCTATCVESLQEPRSFLDVKPSKESKKKGKQDKTTKKGCKQMKKRPSLTDSENGGENTQNSLKKRVKKRKRVLTSSDEDESGRKEIDADGSSYTVK